MALRKLTEQELADLKVGTTVAIMYFDPNGRNPDPITKMTTEFGTVSSIMGDPNDRMERMVFVRLSGGVLDYFGEQLWVSE